MDSKWGIPVAAALAGMGLFLCTRSSKESKDAEYDHYLRYGWPQGTSPAPILRLFQKSQLAEREYYRQMIEYAKGFELLTDSDPYVVELNRKFEFYDLSCDNAGILEDGKVESEYVHGFWYRPIIPQYALRTSDNWEAEKWADVGGPLNPIELHMGLKKSRLNVQNYLGAVNPKNVHEWRKALREWEKGDVKRNKPNLYQKVVGSDPRFQFEDFSLTAQARELYFYQFSLTGMTYLQRFGGVKEGKLDMPFDYFKCVQFMNDFLIQEGFIGGWMESRAIEELTSHPLWPPEWGIAKSHSDTDGAGADLVVYVKGKTLPNPLHIQRDITAMDARGLKGTTDYSDVVGLIQVKPASFVSSNLAKKKRDADATTKLDELRRNARGYHNPPNNPAGWLKWGKISNKQKIERGNTDKLGNPVPPFQFYVNRVSNENPDEFFEFPPIAVADYNYRRDANGDFIIHDVVVDGIPKKYHTKTVLGKPRGSHEESLPKFGKRVLPSRDKILLQLMVYEKERGSVGFDNITDAHWLNKDAVMRRIIANLQDPVLEFGKDDRLKPKDPDNYWNYMTLKSVKTQ